MTNFFILCVFVEVDSRLSLPCHRRPWHLAASGAVDPKGIMVPAGRAKVRYGDRSHHGFVGSGKISRAIFETARFFPSFSPARQGSGQPPRNDDEHRNRGYGLVMCKWAAAFAAILEKMGAAVRPP